MLESHQAQHMSHCKRRGVYVTESEKPAKGKGGPGQPRPRKGKPVNGARLQELREGKLWSQAQLAESAGVSTPTISRAEHGQTISWANVRALATALRVKTEELLAEADASFSGAGERG
jgi:DNA-binding XRE family transcriptional regulator